MFKKKLQQKIKIELLKNNITQVDLANELGVARQYLNSIINGKCENLLLETKILERLNINDTRK